MKHFGFDDTVDQYGRLLDFRGEEITVRLHIRRLWR